MTNDTGATRYPGYDVLNKRDTPSWDAITREVVEERLCTPRQPRFFNPQEWEAVRALCDCVVAQPDDRLPVPVAAMLDTRLFNGEGDGWRDARMPGLRGAWRNGLLALDAESRADHETPFARLMPAQQIDLIERMQRGDLRNVAWQDMPSDLFFSERVLHDLYGAYYAHPASWSEIGFGGPANPRGYVRLDKNRREPWEPIEASTDSTPEHRDEVARENARVR